MKLPEDTTSLNWEELLALVAQLERQVAQLAASNEALQAENAELKRGAKRQTAPFSIRAGLLLCRLTTRCSGEQSQAPGPQARLGTFSFRQAPQSAVQRPEEITEPPVNVPVTLESCLNCGRKLTEERVDFAYITDLPSVPQPKVTQYRVWVCRCLGCGRRVRGEHPDLAPDQYGATAHRLGKRALAAAHTLHYQVGIPVRKVPLVLTSLKGLTLTQGAITQDALRRSRGRVGQVYQALRAGVRDSPVVYTDDTGWQVGGEKAHLMAFDTDQAMVYQVRPRHRHQEVQEVVPANCAGVMVTDWGRSYAAHSFRRIKQQQCLAHLQKTLSALLEKKKGRAREFGENLKMLLRMVLDLWEEYHAGAVAEFEARAAELRFVISYLLREWALRDPDNRHLLKVLRRYHQWGELLRFLEVPSIEPTNN